MSDDTLRELGASNSGEVVLELRKSLYSLKKAGRIWSQLLHARLTDAEFVRCVTEMCLYFRRDDEELVVVGVYVDDLLAVGTSAAAVEKLFEVLAKLQIKDSGCVHKLFSACVSSLATTAATALIKKKRSKN